MKTISMVIELIEGLKLADVRREERALLNKMEVSIGRGLPEYRADCRRLQILRAVISTFSLDELMALKKGE